MTSRGRAGPYQVSRMFTLRHQIRQPATSACADRQLSCRLGLSPSDHGQPGPGSVTMTAEHADPRLVVPPLPPRYVPRPRLLATLNGAAGLPLVVLAAGAGAGKTVLLTDWALTQQAPVGWINLTAADAVPRRFWPL